MNPTTKPRLLRLGATLAAVALLATGCASDDPDDGASSAPPSASATAPSLDFVGPNGEVPGALDELSLTADEIAEVKAGTYTAAFVWHTTSEFVDAVEKGARDQFAELGIEVVASTQANFDAATQANNMESVLALSPDVIVAIAADATSAASTWQAAVDAGVKIAIMTTPPAGWSAGDQFVSIVTEDLAQAGKINSDLLGDALDGKGQIVYMYHDVDFWFTNQRDAAFKAWMNYSYPDIEIVSEQGFTDEAKTQEIAAAMLTRYPDITGIYVPWATAAQGVLAALRDAGRTDVKVVTNDLDATLAADMVRDGNMVGLVGNGAIGIGQGLAISAAYGLLDKTAPELVASTPIGVTADNLDDAWAEDYGTEPPDSIR